MKSSSTRGLLLAVLLIIVIAAAFWWWRTGAMDKAVDEAKGDASKMTMEMASMSITDIEDGVIHVANQLIIKNPLPVTLQASRLDYTVQINGLQVAKGSYKKPIRLPASGRDTLSLPMQVQADAMARVIAQMDSSGKDIATYKFLNTIYTDIPIAGERQIKFNLEEELPVVRLPELMVGKLKVDDVGLKNSAVNMTMHINNPNAFPIRMKDGRYSMTIDGETTMEGNMQEVVNLPAKETTEVGMEMEMKTGEALKTGWKMLFDKKDTHYELSFDSKILSEKELLKNSNMHFNEEGNLQELIKTAKEAKEEKKKED